MILVIVATLIGLLVRAADKVRHKAAMTQCTNSLKQIGLAIHNYHDAFRRCPRAVDSRSSLPVNERLSWMLAINAYLGSNMDPLWRTDPDQPWDAEKNRYVTTAAIPLYTCPLIPSEFQGNWTSYVGVAGIGTDAIDLPEDHARAGFFGYYRTISINKIPDGASNTMWGAETNRDNGPWAQPGYTTVRGVDPDGTDYLGRHGQFGSEHFKSTGFMSGQYQTLVGLADATVRPLSASVAPRIVEALATINGGERLPDDF